MLASKLFVRDRAVDLCMKTIYVRGCLKALNQCVVHFLVWCQAQFQVLQRKDLLGRAHRLRRSPPVLLQRNLGLQVIPLFRISGMRMGVLAPHCSRRTRIMRFLPNHRRFDAVLVQRNLLIGTNHECWVSKLRGREYCVICQAN